MITNYKKSQADVVKAYEAFLPIITEVKNGKETTYDKSLKDLKLQAEQIKQNKFLLMVVGEAKCGKSTFINAYLGEEILPMDVKQCTSAIVEIRYGEKILLKATYADNRIKKIRNIEEIKRFLAANGAIDDNYRDIPISNINMELLIPKAGEQVYEKDIQCLLKDIENGNIHRLPKKEYEAKIRKYIEEKQPQWKNIVKKIEIEYPFADRDLKGIEIVDTPGVNAAGKVGYITEKYINEANAVMFLKPATGQALESSSFRSFLNSASAKRNKDAMFWVLTRKADLNDSEADRQLEEAKRQCKSINTEQIILIDSKAELFYKKVEKLTKEEIKELMQAMDKENKLDNFVMAAFFKSDDNREKFLEILKEISNFNVMDQALNKFAHKAHYIMLLEFLKLMLSVTEKAKAGLEENIRFYKKKAEDPIELGNKINHIESELSEISNKINKNIDGIREKYCATEGIIRQDATSVINEYKAEKEKIKSNSERCFDALEDLSFSYIDRFKEYEIELQKKIIAKCDDALLKLNNKSSIEYNTMRPEFTREDFAKIKETEKSKATERYAYEDGITFTETKYGTRYSRDKHFTSVSKSIESRLEKIKNQAIDDLDVHINKITQIYSEELTKNAKIKRQELKEIKQAKQTAEEIQETIVKMQERLNKLADLQEHITKLKEGIGSHV